LAGFLRVDGNVAWIGGPVLAGTKLQRVDEDPQHDHIALGPGPLDQSEVTGVQSSHRRDQPHLAARGALLVQSARELLERLDHLHAAGSSAGGSAGRPPTRRSATSTRASYAARSAGSRTARIGR